MRVRHIKYRLQYDCMVTFVCSFTWWLVVASGRCALALGRSPEHARYYILCARDRLNRTLISALMLWCGLVREYIRC